MAVEMDLREGNIAVINGKAYRAYAWYTDDRKPVMIAVAGQTPLTLEDIGDEYYIVRQRPLYMAFLRSHFPFAGQLIEKLRDKQPLAYCALGLSEDAVEASFAAQMEALAANHETARRWAHKIHDSTGTLPYGLVLSAWRVERRAQENEKEN